MRKDKLYTVNKGNKRFFAVGGSSSNPFQGLEVAGDGSLFNSSSAKQFSQPIGTTAAAEGGNFMSKLSGAFGAGKLSSAQGAGIGLGASVVGGLGKSLISNGLSTKTGEAIAGIGSTVGNAISTVNPIIGGAVTLGSNLIGGITNAGWGYKVYGKEDAQNYLDNTSGVTVTGSNDDIESIASTLAAAPNKVTYKNGWFTNKGKKEAAAWNNRVQQRENFLDRSIGNAAMNNIINQNNLLQSNYAAFGGPIDSAIEYDLATDYLTAKKKDMESRNKITAMPNSFIGGSDNMFAIGGTLQSHEANFGNGNSYRVGDIIEISSQEAEQLKKLGYEYTVIE